MLNAAVRQELHENHLSPVLALFHYMSFGFLYIYPEIYKIENLLSYRLLLSKKALN
jgi:hypothetical protein